MRLRRTRIEKCKMKENNLSERLLNFAAEVIKLAVKLNKTAVGPHIGGQLTRASTSAGTNYEEACGAESRADFIHKIADSIERITRVTLLVTFNKKDESDFRSSFGEAYPGR